MARHVSEEGLMDLLEGGGARELRRHLAACPRCSQRLQEAAAGLELARAADVPEPPALYWEAFRRRLGRRLGERSAPGGLRWLLPAAALAAALAVALWSVPGSRRAAPASRLAVVPAWSALPPADQDEGLAVLEGLALTQADLGLPREEMAVAAELTELSEEESRAFTDALRGQLEGGDL